MQDSIFRLESNTVDVVVKTHPFAEILYWGAHLQHFSPQDVLSIARPVANGRLDVDSPVTLMAELGTARGWTDRRYLKPRRCSRR